MSEVGLKFDDGKLRYDLSDDNAEEEFIAVLSFGAIKHGDNNWRHVAEAERRFYAAVRRHLRAWRRGQRYDAETRLHHLAHALCDLHFLLALDLTAEDAATFATRYAHALAVAAAHRAKRPAGNGVARAGREHAGPGP